MTVLATDDFNRADENPLGNGVWTAPLGASDALKIVTNQITSVTLGDDCLSLYDAVAWPNDQYGQITVPFIDNSAVNETGIGLALRYTDSTHFYIVVINRNASTNLTFAKKQGSYSVLQQFTVTVANGDTFKAEVQGTNLKAYVNGAQVGSTVADPTTTLTTGDLGVYCSGPVASATRGDAFEGGDFASASTGLAWITA